MLTRLVPPHGYTTPGTCTRLLRLNHIPPGFWRAACLASPILASASPSSTQILKWEGMSTHIFLGLIGNPASQEWTVLPAQPLSIQFCASASNAKARSWPAAEDYVSPVTSLIRGLPYFSTATAVKRKREERMRIQWNGEKEHRGPAVLALPCPALPWFKFISFPSPPFACVCLGSVS